MSALKEKEYKVGKVKFRSQKEINEERRRKREQEIKAVNERVQKILKGEDKKTS